MSKTAAGNQVEHGKLDLGEELHPRGAHEADDQRADQRALEAAEAADDDDDERQDERIDAHAEHGGLRRHDHGAAEPRHEAADGEGLHVDAPDIEAQCGGHAPVLGGGAQDDAEARAIDEPPQADGCQQADADDDQVVNRIEQAADGNAAHAVHDGAGAERRAAEQHLHGVFQDHQQPEGDEQHVLLGTAIERAQQSRLDDCADRGDGEGADGQQQELAGEREVAAGGGAEHAADRPGRDVGAERIERPMRQIDDAHDAVDEAQAGSDEEQHGRVEQRVQHLDD